MVERSLGEYLAERRRGEGAPEGPVPPEFRNGTISKIVVENFMCHDKVEMKFDRRVNYFTGSNGSGKSAMMTAIVVGLGGSSRAVDRGSSVIGLIKHGQSYASITISLNNTVEKDAYRYEDYGPQIIVNRVIRPTGSVYKISDHRGRVISTKKEELDRIIDTFKIAVSNPVICMSQDMVKKFVRQSTPKSVYERMAEGTGMTYMKKMVEKNRRELGTYERELRQIDTILENSDVTLETDCNDLAGLEERLEAKQKVDELKTELAWIQVAEAEKALEVEKKKLADLGVGQDFDGAKKSIADEVEKLEAEKAEKKKEIDEIMSAKRDFDKEVEDLRLKSNQLKRKKMDKDNELVNTRSRKQALEQKCDAIRQEFERSQSQQAATRLIEAKAKKDELEPQLPELQKTVEDTEKTLRDVLMSIQSAEAGVRQVKRKRQELEAKRSDLQRAKLDVEKDSTNTLAAFPRPFRTMAEAISRAKFEKPPIGPLGAHIKLKKEYSKWGSIVETIIGRLMTTYVCGSQADAKQLNAIVERTFTGSFQSWKPAVISTRYCSLYNYQNDAAATRAGQYVSLVDVLDVEDDYVMNALIDNRSVHQILLFDDAGLADRLLEDRSRVPRNCMRAYTLNSFEYHPAPRYRSYHFPTRSRINMLQVSGGDALARFENDIAEIETELDQLLTEERLKEQELRRVRNDRVPLETAANEARTELQEIQKRLRKLDYTIRVEEANSKQPTDMEERLNAAKEEVARCDADLERLQEEKQQFETGVNQLIDEIKKKREEKGQGFEKIRDLETEISELEKAKERKQEELQKLRRKSMVFDRERQERSSKLSKVTSDLEAATRKAESLGDRPEELRTKRDVEKQLDRCKRAAAFGGYSNEEEAEKKRLELKKRVKDMAAEIETLSEKRKIIARLLETQRHCFDLVEEEALAARDAMTAHLTRSFIETAKVRNLLGDIRVNHGEQTMDLLVSTLSKQNGGQAHMRDDMASLSGGERSFTTIALILSIWDCSATPFHMCDEFDVYLDTVARKMALTTIHRDAVRAYYKQFFFLSPQDDTVIMRDDHTTIHKMPRPVRVNNNTAR